MVVIIPAAGEGSRFVKAGYALPKPFIPARGVPMVLRVLDMFEPMNYLLIGQKKHEELYEMNGVLDRTVLIDKHTEGAAITILCAEGRVADDEEVLICNSDNLFDIDVARDFLARAKKFDGALLTFEVDGGPWSYARVDAFDRVLEVAEKRKISNLATAGLYYFKSWRAMRNAIYKMTCAGHRYNNELYLAPAYNFLGDNVVSIRMPPEAFIPLGTPDALEAYNARG